MDFKFYYNLLGKDLRGIYIYIGRYWGIGNKLGSDYEV